mgnify:CR=1 FL=1
MTCVNSSPRNFTSDESIKPLIESVYPNNIDLARLCSSLTNVLSFFLPSFVRRDVSLSTNPGVSHTMNTVVNCYCPINVTLYNLVICEFLMVFLFYAHVCSTQSDLTMIHLELNKLTRCKGRESSTHAYGRVLTLLDI